MTQRKEILSAVKRTVLEITPRAEIILFGSRSRGDHSEYSDWDFLIITETEVTEELKKEIRNQLFEIELEMELAISTIIHSKKEWARYEITPLYKNIEKEGEAV
jgi:predicted nucleotidyltransferase